MRKCLLAALLVLVACGGGDEQEQATDLPATTTTQVSAATATTATASGCGVTLADVQALLPANSGVTQNRTPEATRCNFTWNDNGARGIDVARVLGGRAAFEAQSGKAPNGPNNLKDGTPYESLSGLGERAWAYGNARQANVVVLRGADLFAANIVTDGAAPTGAKSPTGMDTKFLEIGQALVKKALG